MPIINVYPDRIFKYLKKYVPNNPDKDVKYNEGDDFITKIQNISKLYGAVASSKNNQDKTIMQALRTPNKAKDTICDVYMHIVSVESVIGKIQRKLRAMNYTENEISSILNSYYYNTNNISILCHEDDYSYNILEQFESLNFVLEQSLQKPSALSLHLNVINEANSTVNDKICTLKKIFEYLNEEFYEIRIQYEENKILSDNILKLSSIECNGLDKDIIDLINNFKSNHQPKQMEKSLSDLFVKINEKKLNH